MQELKEPVPNRDHWGTPPREFHIICSMWGLVPTMDVCASKENTRCIYFIDEQMDAFKTEWEAYNGVCWMNPPYSQPLMTRFIERAIDQSGKHGIAVVFLLPDNIDHEWYDLIMPFPHKVWRDPEQKKGRKTHRIEFIPPAGVKPSSARNGNIHGVIDVWGRFV